jgi:hypothetical protein
MEPEGSLPSSQEPAKSENGECLGKSVAEDIRIQI